MGVSYLWLRILPRFALQLHLDQRGTSMARTSLAIVAALSLVTSIAGAQAPPDEKTQKAMLHKAELFIAITNRDAAGAKAALARGADPNSRNWLDFTPLMWAAA